MGDRPHLSNEQEFFFTYGHSNESITTTSSTSSPVNSIAPNNFGGFNWPPQATSAAATNFDSGVNHPRFDYSSQGHVWSSPQPQQHHYLLPHQQQHAQFQQQLLHQQRQYHQNMSYRSPLIMQGSPYEEPYRGYMDNNELMQYNTPHLATDVNQHMLHKANSYHQQHNPNTSIPMTGISTNSYYPPQYIPPDKVITPLNEEDELHFNKTYNNVKNKSKDLKIIETSPSSSSSFKPKIKNKTPSPKSTPLPSPLIPSTITAKKRRVDGDSRRNSIVVTSSTQQQSQPRQQKQQGGGKRTQRQQQQEVFVEEEEGGGVCNVLKEGDVNREAVDQIENELAFLRDECATILIMLDSLRNAFITDVSSSSDQTNRSATLPLTGTINFMENDTAFNNSTNQNFATKIRPRRSIVMAQNPEMEREMRIAYDDLMLQVRQLEKKVERLEVKSKNACILENLKAKRRKNEDEDEDEQRYSLIGNAATSETIHSGSSCASSCGSDDEYVLSENEIDGPNKPRKRFFSRKGQSK